MEASRDDGAERIDFDHYLPGMPRVASQPGRFERFLKRLFRQRGGYRVRVSRRDE